MKNQPQNNQTIEKLNLNQKTCQTDDILTEANNSVTEKKVEIGGRDGLEPTRYGDWEKNGRCIDF